jgi:hypothetical protein
MPRRSGTKKELERKKEGVEKAVRQIVKRHREVDVREADRGVIEQEERYVDTLREKIKKIRVWLRENGDKAGKSGKLAKSNRRLGTAEPPFAHICSILGLDRFTLRGKPKVNTQWLFYCIVHNLTKIHRYGEGLA